jgi:predicted nucleic-acid-binding protein
MEEDKLVSIDTHLLIRFLVVDDDEEQCQAALQIFQNQIVFVPETVLLEAEWVLRAAYQISCGEIRNALLKLTRLPKVRFPDRNTLSQVLELYSQGLDFADAWHLVRSEGIPMKTFDKAFIQKARKAGFAVSLP